MAPQWGAINASRASGDGYGSRMLPSFTFDAELWLAKAENPWVFLTVPPDISDEIEGSTPVKGGFGSVKVEATIGGSVWTTSLFPDGSLGAYVLPVKKAVRSAERVDVGDTVSVTLAVVEHV